MGLVRQARKLTPEERREKKRKKIIADKSKEVRRPRPSPPLSCLCLTPHLPAWRVDDDDDDDVLRSKWHCSGCETCRAPRSATRST